MKSLAIGRCRWQTDIARAWRDANASAVEGFLEVGRMLIAAKAQLKHGEFTKMIENELPFDRTTAFRLVAVAENRVLSNVAHAQHLPSSWYALYLLTRVPEKTLQKAITDGRVSPTMERKAVSALLPEKSRATKPQGARSSQAAIVHDGQNGGAFDPVTRLYFELERTLRRSFFGFSESERSELLALVRKLIDGLEEEARE